MNIDPTSMPTMRHECFFSDIDFVRFWCVSGCMFASSRRVSVFSELATTDREKPDMILESTMSSLTIFLNWP